MAKLLSFVKLDFLTVRPYITSKTLIIYLAVTIIVIISARSAAAGIVLLMVYASLYATTPFSVGEKNGLDVLYASLSIEKNTVVMGRYLFAQIINAFSALFGCIFSVGVSWMAAKSYRYYQNPFEIPITIIAMFLICGLTQAMLLPLFFKIGYAKARFFTYLPFIVLFLLGMSIDVVIKNNRSNFTLWYESNKHWAVLIFLIAWLGIMFLSYLVSLIFYKKYKFFIYKKYE